MPPDEYNKIPLNLNISSENSKRGENKSNVSAKDIQKEKEEEKAIASCPYLRTLI